MKAGFTGTRDGMTEAQFIRFKTLLAFHGPEEFRHGCCLGADEQAGVFAYEWSPFVKVIGHPSNIKAMTSAKALACCHEICDPKPPLDRDKDIVDALTEPDDILFATPKGVTEEVRSGTWFTVRLARKAKPRVIIIYPDGTTNEEGG